MIATDAKCLSCGAPVDVFISSGRPYKYCSNACRYRRRRPAAVKPASKACTVCGDEFESPVHGKKYCSVACSERFVRDRRLEARRTAAPEVNCKHCGERIEGAKANQSYCCTDCRDMYLIKKRQAGSLHECKGCGKVFRASHRRQYCTDECKPSVYVPVDKGVKQCEFCGDEFTATPNRKYCSPHCGYRANKAKQRSKRKHIDRARANNRRYEPINPQKVFERDSWLCGICLAPVDRDTVVPAPLAATLDHIVPLSRGGHHELDNVRCAHFMCNSIKSGKLDEEITWPADDLKHRRTS